MLWMAYAPGGVKGLRREETYAIGSFAANTERLTKELKQKENKIKQLQKRVNSLEESADSIVVTRCTNHSST